MIKITEPESKKYKIYRELYLLNEKKIKNSLMEALIKLNNLTKKEAKKIIKNMHISEKIPEEKFSNLSNNDLKILDKILENFQN